MLLISSKTAAEISSEIAIDRQLGLRAKALNEYHNLHGFCPNCGSADFSQTCVGVLEPPDRTNDFTCQSCGAGGKIDDLVSEKMAEIIIRCNKSEARVRELEAYFAKETL